MVGVGKDCCDPPPPGVPVPHPRSLVHNDEDGSLLVDSRLRGIPESPTPLRRVGDMTELPPFACAHATPTPTADPLANH